MKEKLLIIVMILTGIGHAATGQTKSNFEIGLQQITANTILRGNEVLDRVHQSKIGLGLSVYFQYNTGGTFSVRAEPGLEQKGTRLVISESRFNAEPYLRTTFLYLDYVTFPVLARFSFGNKVKYFVNAGPYVGYLLNNPSTEFTCGTDDPGDYYYYHKDFDAGVTFGAGISVPIKQIVVSLEARNNFGLYDINQHPDVQNAEIRNHTYCLLLGLGYRFIK